MMKCHNNTVTCWFHHPLFLASPQGAQGPSGPAGPAGARGMAVSTHTNTHTHTDQHAGTQQLVHQINPCELKLALAKLITKLQITYYVFCIHVWVFDVHRPGPDVCVPRDPKAHVETRERQESLVRGDRRDTEDSPVSRVCPDLR